MKHECTRGTSHEELEVEQSVQHMCMTNPTHGRL